MLKRKDTCKINNRVVGTPDYRAPEVIKMLGCNHRSLDYWSMGVILYEFLVGIPPFNDDSIEKIHDNIVNFRIEWPPIGDDEDSMSENAYDLIKKLLIMDPKKRLGANGV